MADAIETPPDRVWIHQELGNWQTAGGDFSGRQIVDCTVRNLSVSDGLLNYFRALVSRLEHVSLDHSRCEQAYWSDCQVRHLAAQTSFFTGGCFLHCQWLETVAELSSFALTAWQDCHWQQSRLSEVGFIGSVWRGCRFTQENYNFVRFPRSLFIDTEFKDCFLRKAIFRRAVFIRCRFTHCRLPESVFENARFQETDFVGTDRAEAANWNGAQGL
ncbi:MAG: pentapeptide repeat-containing protein [Sedimentisphaerales bacterium]|nr:pentapeptide repeat-containing protein [Sedimentisphaerales bacterium]